MTKLQKTLMASLLTLSIATVAVGGTITGSRTARTGTITGSRTGTITGSRTGTISGSRTGTITGSRTGTITGSRTGQGIIPTQSTTHEEWVSKLMFFLSTFAW